MMISKNTRAGAGFRAMAGLAALLAGVACHSPTAIPSTASFAMRIGTNNDLPGGAVSVTLYRVDDDSRCPIGVSCISAGNAVVVFGMSTCIGCLPAQQSLNTNVEPRSLDINGFHITLDSLLPPRHVDQVIAQGDYAAYVTVTKLGGGGT